MKKEFPKPKVSTGQLLNELLDEARKEEPKLSFKSFAKRFEYGDPDYPAFSFRQFERLLIDKAGDEILKDPIVHWVRFLQVIARVAKVPPLDILKRMRLRDALTAVPFDSLELSVSHFVEWPTSNYRVREAVETAIKARHLYSNEGSIRDARNEYDKAINKFKDADLSDIGITLLKAYIQTHMSSTCEVLGKPDEAEY